MVPDRFQIAAERAASSYSTDVWLTLSPSEQAAATVSCANGTQIQLKRVFLWVTFDPWMKPLGDGTHRWQHRPTAIVVEHQRSPVCNPLDRPSNRPQLLFHQVEQFVQACQYLLGQGRRRA